MVFSSLPFLFLFLPAVLLVSHLLPFRLRNGFLLLANLVFYAYGEPVYVLIMIGSILVNFFCGLAIGGAKGQGSRKAALVLGIILNLAALGVFKYAGLFTGTLRHIPALSGLPEVKLALPIGISFYTFQAMSYSIDVYRGDAQAQRSPVNFAVYVTLFPQLIAGPIVRYKDVAAQIDGHRAPPSQFARGIRMFAVGLGKKVLIANQMGLLWDALRPGAAANGVIPAWVGIIAYTFQIYFDFSGYSDMACGLGNMLGLRFMRNFDYPYISASVTEFWRRWHISLSTWFRDYVYIPLGGSRAGKGRTILNLLVVWFLTGMWHGASWNFILWGLYYFVILVIEKTFLLKRLERAPALGRVYTMLLVILGWVLFYFDAGMSDCLAYLGAMFGRTEGWLAPGAVNTVARYIPALLAAAVASTPLGARLWNRFAPKDGVCALEIVLVALCLALCTAALVSQSYNPFLYFKF